MTSRLIILGVILVVLAGVFGALADSSPGANASNLSDQVGAPETATPTSISTPPPEPTAAITNRQDCDQIRGTDYFSVLERQWFLSTCVQR